MTQIRPLKNTYNYEKWFLLGQLRKVSDLIDLNGAMGITLKEEEEMYFTEY